MAFIDKEYERKCLCRRWGKNGTGDTCCLRCRGHAKRKPKCDRHKDKRWKKR